jgi:hypothetical protein
MMSEGKGPVPADLREGRFNPDREGQVLKVILGGLSDGTNQGIYDYLRAHPPENHDGEICWPTVTLFTKRAVEAGIIQRVGSGQRAVYVPLDDGPPFARATSEGLAFRRRVLAGRDESKHWIAYWNRREAENALEGQLLLSIGSDQLRPEMRGDTIWVVYSPDKARLETIGLVRVGQIVSKTAARRILPYEPYDKAFHAIADVDSAVVPRRVDLTGMLGELRFGLPGSRVKVLDLGKPLGLQLQAMRRLTPESASLISGHWDAQLRHDEQEFVEVSNELASLGASDRRTQMLARTEQSKLRRLLFGDAGSGTCAICGNAYPVSLLVAAHIKRRADCTEQERNDWKGNVAPMCVFGCDALFERGVITVKKGKVAIGKYALGAAVAAYTGQLSDRECAHWGDASAKYYMWHASKERGTRSVDEAW